MAAKTDEDSASISGEGERGGGTLSSYLYLFYDCEGSGGSAIRDHMLEVAAVVRTDNLELEAGDRERLEREHYSSLCQCDGKIQSEALQKHGISEAALVGQQSVRTVLHKLFAWIAERLSEVQRLKGRQYRAVLVSHGGSAFDFPLLVTEVKRNDCEAGFRDLQLYFADTHTLCEELRARNDPVLRGSSKVSLAELHSLYFPSEAASHTPHRALSDALTLRKLFTNTPLSTRTHKLELTTTESLFEKWQSYVDCNELIEKLGIHKQKAKMLIRRGTNLRQLEEAFCKSDYSEQWLRGHLQSLGLRKPNDTCLGYFRRVS